MKKLILSLAWVAFSGVAMAQSVTTSPASEQTPPSGGASCCRKGAATKACCSSKSSATAAASGHCQGDHKTTAFQNTAADRNEKNIPAKEEPRKD
ncbi:MAG: hypothetical protein N2050_02205 [Flavobacteriales bacterium]|nr:hypothetical protein [Flavobacteriales bacterium]MCX7649351.1 hypothetical protein [Flavobacteriales bacterium]MDW8432776.1 hypothetical protein [Flavobacteriales bacterium]